MIILALCCFANLPFCQAPFHLAFNRCTTLSNHLRNMPFCRRKIGSPFKIVFNFKLGLFCGLWNELLFTSGLTKWLMKRQVGEMTLSLIFVCFNGIIFPKGRPCAISKTIDLYFFNSTILFCKKYQKLKLLAVTKNEKILTIFIKSLSNLYFIKKPWNNVCHIFVFCERDKPTGSASAKDSFTRAIMHCNFVL